MNMCVCGVICATHCRAYKTECEGCLELEGRISWARFYGKTHCPIYKCVMDKGLPNCALCGQAPCQIWNDTRNPETSDAEFAEDINKRLANLSMWLKNREAGD